MGDTQWVVNLKNVIAAQAEEHDGAALFAIAHNPKNDKEGWPTLIGWSKGKTADAERRAQMFTALFLGICSQNDTNPTQMLKEMAKLIKRNKVKEKE